MNLCAMVSDRLTGFKSRANAFLLAESALSFCLLLFSLFSSTGWLCGVGVFGLTAFSSLSQLCTADSFIIIIIIFRTKAALLVFTLSRCYRNIYPSALADTALILTWHVLL